ncbi:helix-turn-helix transcriptional regulator [Streptomyces sp. CWNU-52B]|uniref:helix-turn-helix transcriptional regulator n=1 Tax=unclassified Streptomyces TaxID=2593676 RepID=UPI0039BEE3BC
MRMQVPVMLLPVGSTRSGGHGAGAEGAEGDTFGAYLRRCRSRLSPSDVGLVGLRSDGRNRRVEGLRREEVAVLAGVSVDYYGRLEQGRERSPSARTVEALGLALQLDPNARRRLFHLAGLNPSLRPDTTRGQAHPALLRLLDSSDRAVALVLGPSFDILAANAHAQALLSPFGGETNLIRLLFLHPEAKRFFADWPLAATGSLHALRRNAARLPGDTGITDLVAETSAGSPDFAQVWKAAAPADLGRAYGTVVHPAAGRIEFAYRVHGDPAAPAQHLLIATAVPGGRSAEAFTYLAAMGRR